MRNIILTTALLTAFNANANLVVNGGFEAYDVNNHPNNNNTDWVHLSTSSTVEGWVRGTTSSPTEFLEIRTGSSYGTAQEGNNFAELAPGAPSSIKQTINVAQGGAYSLSWYDLTRYGTTSSDTQAVLLGNKAYDYSVFLNGISVFDYVNGNVQGNDVWNAQSVSVDLLGGQDYTLMFSSNAVAGDIGINLDNISLVSSAVAAVPEPETYAMLLAGLALVGFTSRKRKA